MRSVTSCIFVAVILPAWERIRVGLMVSRMFVRT